MNGEVQPSRFLAIVGAFAAWPLLLFIALAGYAAYEWKLNGYSEEAVLLWLIVFPLGAGTGLLASAREGKLDLLFGARISRNRVVAAAFTRTVLLPLVLALPLAVVSVPTGWADIPEAMLRAIGVALLTGGCCFAVGIVNPRYALGVAWMAARVAFLVVRPTFAIYHQLLAARLGAPRPPTGKLLLIAFAFPEIALRHEVPAAVVLAIALAGIAAVLGAVIAFGNAELGGHRSA